MAKLDFDLSPLVGEHELSPAVNFHALIYRRRPDVNAIVHVHSHHISVLSSIEGQTVGMYNVVSVLFHDEQATYFDDGVKPHTDVVDALGADKHVVLMKNHGAIVASDSVENAVIEAITLERAARFHLECVAVGGTEIAEAEVRRRQGDVPPPLPAPDVAGQPGPPPPQRPRRVRRSRPPDGGETTRSVRSSSRRGRFVSMERTEHGVPASERRGHEPSPGDLL